MLRHVFWGGVWMVGALVLALVVRVGFIGYAAPAGVEFGVDLGSVLRADRLVQAAALAGFAVGFYRSRRREGALNA